MRSMRTWRAMSEGGSYLEEDLEQRLTELVAVVHHAVELADHRLPLQSQLLHRLRVAPQVQFPSTV